MRFGVGLRPRVAEPLRGAGSRDFDADLDADFLGISLSCCIRTASPAAVGPCVRWGDQPAAAETLHVGSQEQTQGVSLCRVSARLCPGSLLAVNWCAFAGVCRRHLACARYLVREPATRATFLSQEDGPIDVNKPILPSFPHTL